MVRKISLILVIVILFSTLVGCTNTAGIYSLSREINNIDKGINTGVVEIDFVKIPLDLVEDLEVRRGLEELGKGLAIRYDAEYSNKDLVGKIKLEIKLGKDEYIPFTEYIINKTEMYVKVDDLLVATEKIYNKYVGGEIQDFDLIKEQFTGVDYVKVNFDQISEYEAILEERDEILKTYENIANKLKENYSDFNFKTVSKEGNKYIVDINTENYADEFENILKYLVDNVDKISFDIVKIIEEMSDEEFEALNDISGLEVSKKELISNINEEVKDIKENKEEIKVEIENTAKELREISVDVEGTGLKYTLEKLGKDKYSVGSELRIKYVDLIDFTITSKSEVTAVDSINIDIPKDKVKDMTEVVYRELGIGKTMYVSVDSGRYVLANNGSAEEGHINVILEGGRTYLPLRFIGEKFDEDVQWDNEARIAYINKNGKRIDMEGILRDGRAYVKVRDFEKLGYTVDWDNIERTAIIVK